jgi:hypothetical protein
MVSSANAGASSIDTASTLAPAKEATRFRFIKILSSQFFHKKILFRSFFTHPTFRTVFRAKQMPNFVQSRPALLCAHALQA